MKKSLISLAVLGAFSGAASAQSPVTLYGVVDVNVQRTDFRPGTTTDYPATTSVNSGHMSGSRLGLRGSEDLGGGLRAIYQIESGFTLDEGMVDQGGRLFGRQAYVGLTGNFGTVVAGRLGTFSSGIGALDKFGSIDPFGTNYGLIGFGSTMPGVGLRADNAIAYVTPRLGGFSAGIGHTFRVDGPELAGGSSNNNSGQFMYANYAAGPLYAVVTYDRIKLGEEAGVPTIKFLQTGASYDLKFVKLSAAYAKEDYDLGDSKAWAIGASVPFGAHRFAASYQKLDVDAFDGNPSGKRKVFGLGYEYSLSRRTTLYASYGDLKDDGAMKTVDFGGAKQITVGMNHKF